MNKKILPLIVCIFFFAFAFSGCKKEKETVSDDVKTNVTVYKTDDSSLSSKVAYSGTLSASDSVSISSKVGAKAVRVNVKEGDYVKAGAVLASLDQTDIALSCQQAEAAYSSALAGYNSVVNSSSKQSLAQVNQALNAAQTAYDQAKLNYDREKTLYENASNLKISQQTYDNAKSSYDRIKALFDLGGASQVELDNAYTQLMNAEENLKTVSVTVSASYDAAKSSLTNAENALKNAKENVELTKNSIASSVETSQASVNSARAALNIARNNLSNTNITSPISGYVSKCNVSKGQNVSPGVEIFSVSNTNMVDAAVNVTESVIPFLHEGDEATVSISAAKIENIAGTITLINPVKDQTTGLYKVKISIDNADNILKAGMLCDVILTVSEKDDIIKVPSESLINSDNEYYVYVAKGNKAQKVNVSVGISDNEFTEIVSGLKSGDEVVVAGKDYLSEKNNDINITGEYK